jgi:hypothetical protein
MPEALRAELRRLREVTLHPPAKPTQR